MKDEEFFAKLLATFQLEADEHLKAISDGLLALESKLSQEARKQTIETIFREAHSLKGAARAVDLQAIESLCQALENVLAAWKQERLQPSPELFDTLHFTVDSIRSALTSSLDQSQVSLVIQKLENIKQKAAKEASSTLVEPLETLKPQKQENIASEKLAIPPEHQSISKTTESQESPTVIETFKEKSIRVSLLRMNQVFQEAEEILMIKLIAQKQVIHLKQLLMRYRLQEKELGYLIAEVQQLLQHSYQKQSTWEDKKEVTRKLLTFLAQQQHEIKLSTEDLNKLIKTSEQNTHFIESIADSLLEDMKKVLMQPISTLFETMPHMVRNIARELEKDIQVKFEGGDIEVDRRILEEIKDAVTHLIRNAIDHGIESPEERIKMGKSSFGTIQVIAKESSGNNVELAIMDDGRGMNAKKLKDVAMRQGILSQQEAEEMKDEEAIKLAFHSGVSTSSKVTELSGRGLGLGIVSEKVDKLGGQLSIESKLNQGTTFKLLLPLTLATFRGIHVSVAGQQFIIPTRNVKRVLRIKKEEIKTVTNCQTVTVDHHPVAYVHLADLLGLDRQMQQVNKHQIALLVSGAGTTIAFGVDDVQREQEVLVKSLGKQCKRVKNIMAATVMEGGDVLPILNPLDLIRSATHGKTNQDQISGKREEKTSKKEILLVEDSITTRLLLKNILELAGYEVKTAVDGWEALEMLQVQKVDLLLTDIEMPRMDGFTLIEKVKKIPFLQEMPIVIVTSRGSIEDRERGIELGAHAYLDKSNFTQQDLINLLKKLL
jgi:two-component system chemotaxis sensor kinase CheA